jgi:prevent-host-death family protein
MAMKKMGAGEFKAKCLKVMDDVAATREPVVITKNGRPVAKLVPAQLEAPNFMGCLVGIIEIKGDIESPMIPPEDWEATR